MSGLLEPLLLGAALVLAVPVCVLFAEVLAAMPAARGPAPVGEGPRPRIAVLVPAHDEAAEIVETLRGLRPQLVPGDRLLVVADNCTDDTAKLARAAGAEVTERFDDRLRGKGYALDFGVDALKAAPPEVLVIVDADCQVGPNALARIARVAFESGRPVQSLYLMRAPEGAGIGRRLAEFAWAVKNHVRPLGGYRLGMPCQLMGTGMALPWERVGAASLATGHIAEDMFFGINLARAGAPPTFCPDALVTSTFAASDAGERSQRRRWEHGHISLIVTQAPKLFLEAILRRDVRLAWMALDVTVPPVALLALLTAALLTAGGALALLAGKTAPLAFAVVLMAMLAAAVLLAWLRHGRSIVSLGQLFFAPVYALRKIPLYLGFLTRRQVDWVRTRRDR